MSSIPQAHPQVKTSDEPGYVRCAGCYNWTNSYTVELTAEAIGFAMCEKCSGPCDEQEYDTLIRNIMAYTGGEVWRL